MKWGNEDTEFDTESDFGGEEKTSFPIIPVVIGGVVLILFIMILVI